MSYSVSTTFCPKCGSQADTDGTFCKHCGQNLHQPKPATIPRSMGLWITGGVAICLIAVVVAVSLSKRDNNQKAGVFNTSANSTNTYATTNSTTTTVSPKKVDMVINTTSSQSGNELSRETILSLVKGKYSKKVTVSMSDQSAFPYVGDWTPTYAQMVNDKVLICVNKGNYYSNCRPGPNSNGLYISTANNGTTAGSLSLDLGNKVPSAVTGISKVDQTTAYADIVFSIEPSSSYSLYQKYRDAFHSSPPVESEQHRAVLRLYDDGWRVERIN